MLVTCISSCSKCFPHARVGSSKACEKSSGWLWKESSASTGVRKPGDTCVTDRHNMTIAVKVALNLNTINQSIPVFSTYSDTNPIISATNNLSSVNAFNLELSKISSLVKYLKNIHISVPLVK